MNEDRQINIDTLSSTSQDSESRTPIVSIPPTPLADPLPAQSEALRPLSVITDAALETRPISYFDVSEAPYLCDPPDFKPKDCSTTSDNSDLNSDFLSIVEATGPSFLSNGGDDYDFDESDGEEARHCDDSRHNDKTPPLLVAHPDLPEECW
jgi:hypothetical protein